MSTQSEDILTFWFEEAGPTRWWSAADDFDALVRERFATVHAAAARGALDDWAQTARGALALVIVLDQFPRNMYRGQPEAYMTDAAALEVTRAALNHGFEQAFVGPERHFLFMPFMHSERLADQDEAVRLGEAIQTEDEGDFLKHARQHRDVVARFGRFPHRNAVLGRVSTPDEEAYLAAGGGWT